MDFCTFFIPFFSSFFPSLFFANLNERGKRNIYGEQKLSTKAACAVSIVSIVSPLFTGEFAEVHGELDGGVILLGLGL